MQIHIGRNNQQLGTFTVPQVLSGLASGQFLPTDNAWHEGLDDWGPLSSLEILSAPPPAPAVSAAPAATVKPAFSLPKLARPEQPPSTIKAWAVRVAVFAVLLAIALPTAQFIKGKSLESKSKANAGLIIGACKKFAAAHDGSYPPDLATLVTDKIIADEQPLHCPLLHDDTRIGYDYYAAGVKQTDPPQKVIVISKAATPAGMRVVGYNDGSVKMEAVPELPPAK